VLSALGPNGDRASDRRSLGADHRCMARRAAKVVRGRAQLRGAGVLVAPARRRVGAPVESELADERQSEDGRRGREHPSPGEACFSHG